MFKAAILGFVCAATAVAAASGNIQNFEADSVPAGWTVAGRGELCITPERFKSGSRSLRWTWEDAGAEVNCAWPDGLKIARTPGGAGRPGLSLAFWMYNERPIQGVLYLEFLSGPKTAGRCWISLNFKGWRPLASPYAQVLKDEAAPVTGFRLLAPQGVARGRLYIDYVNPACAQRVQADDRQPWIGHAEMLSSATPERFIYSKQDLSANRPWLPARIGDADITERDRQDLAKLAGRFPCPGLARKADATVLEDCAQSLVIKRNGDILTGRPIGDLNELNPVPDAVDFRAGPHARVKAPLAAQTLLTRLAGAYLFAKSAGKTDETARYLQALFDVCDHLSDQGEFDIDLPCIGAMREELASSGRLGDLVRNKLSGLGGLYYRALIGKDFSDVSELPYGNADLMWGPYYRMPNVLLLLPDPAERMQYLQSYKRLLDGIASSDSPEPFQADATAHHHGMFHINYGSSSMWRFMEVAHQLRDTRFRLSPATMLMLKRNLLAMAFASNRIVMAPSMTGYTGEPFIYDSAPWALLLARCGTPDGGLPVDPEMASLYLALTAEPNGPAAKEFAAMGIKPFKFDGHLSLNSAAISLHRRNGWLVTIAGMNGHYRGLEQSAGYPASTYARFARNGSVFVTSAGNPVSPMGSGFRFSGWDYRFWPGATTLLAPPQDLLRCGPFYALMSESRFGGGTSLDADGIWGEDFISSASDGLKEMRFRKSAFCFGSRVTVITTDIQHADAKTEPFVTTLFQCAFGVGNLFNRLTGPTKPIDVPPAEEPCCVDGQTVADFPWSMSLAGDRPHWLMDNKGNGYYIPAGNPPVQVARRPQTWTFFADYFLKDPAHPLKSPYAPMNSFPEKPLAANEKYYNSTSGNFALAWFDHGRKPDVPQCVYTVMPKCTAMEVEKFARSMANAASAPVCVIEQNSRAHALFDRESNTAGYVIFDSQWRPSPVEAPERVCRVLRQASRPCFVMVRDGGQSLRISVATTENLKRIGPRLVPDGPLELTFAGQWDIRPADPANAAACRATCSAGMTTLSISNQDFMPLGFEMKPVGR